MGFEELGAETGTSAKSLIRMFGARGNPQARDFFAALSRLRERAGLRLLSPRSLEEGRLRRRATLRRRVVRPLWPAQLPGRSDEESLIAAAATTKPIYSSKVRHGYDAFRGRTEGHRLQQLLTSLALDDR